MYTEEELFQEDIVENKFFQDFLLFLRELQKRPLELTKTGNLKRKEIYYFGEHFLIDIYHRDEKGLILIPILTEDEAPYLVRIRTIAHVMGLTYKRKDKLLLSAKGETFLNIPSILQQFEQTILAYFTPCNWSYLHPSLYELSGFLQKNQQYLWRYFSVHNDKPIDFQIFLEGVCAYFGLKNINEYRDSICWTFERALVQNLALYGVITVETEQVGWNENVVSFELTALGLHIFKLALSPTVGEDINELSEITDQNISN